MSCEMCTDQDGAPCMPVYGIAPHIHFKGGTAVFPNMQTPGFTPDPECEGMGTWWCTHCGDGKPQPKGQSHG